MIDDNPLRVAPPEPEPRSYCEDDYDPSGGDEFWDRVHGDDEQKYWEMCCDV